MSGFATKGPGFGPAPPSLGREQRAPTEAELARKHQATRAAANKTVSHVEAQIEAADSAVAASDVDGFATSKRRAQSGLTQLQYARRRLRGKAKNDEEEQHFAKLEDKIRDLSQQIESLVSPIPKPKPIQGEDLIISSIPARPVGNAKVAFDDAERRLIGILRRLPHKDRTVFLTRIGKNDPNDPLAVRWRRLSGTRRSRIRKAMLAARPPVPPAPPIPVPFDGPLTQLVTSGMESLTEKVSDLTGDLQAHKEPPVSLFSVDANTWLTLNQAQLSGALIGLLDRAIYPLAHPGIGWGPARQSFGGALGQRFGGDVLTTLRAALPNIDLNECANRFRSLDEPAGGASTESAAPRPGSEGGGDASSAHSTSKSIPASQSWASRPDGESSEGGGPLGFVGWEPDVAIAIARAIDAQVRGSIERVAPRAVVANAAESTSQSASVQGFDAGAIVCSHPIDGLVAEALAHPGVVAFSHSADLDRAGVETPEPLRPVQVRWLDTESMWNWVEATPANASAEEVSLALFGTTEKASTLTASAPFFEVALDDATRLTPLKRLAHEARTLFSSGAPATDIDALIGSDVAETAALAQAKRMANDPKTAGTAAATGPQSGASTSAAGAGNKSSADVQGTAAMCRVQLESLDEKFAALGIASGLAPLRARLDGRMAALPTMADGQVGDVAVLFHQQRLILAEVGAMTTRLVPDEDGTADRARKQFGKRLARVAQVSDFCESARAELAAIRSEFGALAADGTNALLDKAHTQLEGIKHLLGTRGPDASTFEGKIEFGDLRTEYDQLRESILTMERSQLAGTLEPGGVAEVQRKIHSFELKVRMISKVTHFNHVQNMLESLGTVKAAMVGSYDDIQLDRVALMDLKSSILVRYRKWLREQKILLASVDSGNTGVEAQVTASMSALEAELKTLGTGRFKKAIEDAYKTIEDTQTRMALLDLAAMIGLALVTSGVGALASGVARGFQLSEMAVGLLGTTAEAGFSSVVMAATSDASFAKTLGTEMLTNVAFFGAFRAFESVWSASRIGSQVTKLKGSKQGIDNVIGSAVEISAQGAMAIGMQTAVAEAQSVIGRGELLSSDQFATMVADGVAMHIGSTIAHRVAKPILDKIEMAGFRGGRAVRAQAKRLFSRATNATYLKDPSATLQLIQDSQHLLEAHAAHEKEAHRDAGASGGTGETGVEAGGAAGTEGTETAHLPDLAINAIEAHAKLFDGGGFMASDGATLAQVVAHANAIGLSVHESMTANGTRVVDIQSANRSVQLRQVIPDAASPTAMVSKAPAPLPHAATTAEMTAQTPAGKPPLAHTAEMTVQTPVGKQPLAHIAEMTAQTPVGKQPLAHIAEMTAQTPQGSAPIIESLKAKPVWKQIEPNIGKFKEALRESRYNDYDSRIEKLRAHEDFGPQLKNLSNDEIIAIIGYTSMDYSELNHALRSEDSSELDRLGPYLRLADDGLSKLPDYVGEVYRGTSLTPELLRTYVPGKERVETAFMSTSSNDKRAFGGNVHFVVLSKTGKDISHMSEFNGEAEVLFRPGVKFLVMEKTVNGDVTTIRMKEI